jgi:hypothetical protein
MKYSEMLDIIIKGNVAGSQFYIAYEMDYQLNGIHEIEVDEKRFEDLCEFAYYCYLKSEGLAMVQIVKCIADYQRGWLKKENKDPLEMEKWDIINVAGCYEF